MLRFLHAHATHPHPELALELVWAQLASQLAAQARTEGPWDTAGERDNDAPTLGWCYVSDALAHGTQAILDGLRQRLPQVAWVGAVGVGVLATRVEYMDEPALVVMLCNLPRADFRIFHGRQPLPALLRVRSGQDSPAWHAHVAQVHADARSPDLPELIAELASRTDTGYLFGGLSAGQHHSQHLAERIDACAHAAHQLAAASAPGRVQENAALAAELLTQLTQAGKELGVWAPCKLMGEQLSELHVANQEMAFRLDAIQRISTWLDMGLQSAEEAALAQLWLSPGHSPAASPAAPSTAQSSCATRTRGSQNISRRTSSPISRAARSSSRWSTKSGTIIASRASSSWPSCSSLSPLSFTWRNRSSARCLAVVISHAAGLSGRPWRGQVSSAATSASCASSSANGTSRVSRDRAPMILADSCRQVVVIARWMSWVMRAIVRRAFRRAGRQAPGNCVMSMYISSQMCPSGSA